MSLPTSWNTKRVFGTFKNFDDGSPASGDITFDPLQVVTLPEGGGRTIVMPRPRTVQLDSSGQIDILLPATDDTDLNITGLIYKVSERIAPANRTYYIEVGLSGGDIDLATVSPMVDPPNLVSTRGQSAYDLWIADGHTGTVTDFLDWLGAIPGPAGPAGPAGPPGDDGTTLTTIASTGGVLTIDCALGDNFITTLTENITSIVLTNEPATEKAKPISLEIEQHASAPKTVAFPAGWGWPGGTVGEVSSTNGAVDELNLVVRNKGGTKRYRAVLVKEWA